MPAIGHIPHQIRPIRKAEIGRIGNQISQVINIPGLFVGISGGDDLPVWYPRRG